MRQIARTFRELEIWQLAVLIAKHTYVLTQQLPEEERYGLVSQMRRAAVSLSANIAEGFRRQSPKEFRQFLRVALGSAAELESFCELCHELFDGRFPQLDELLAQLDRFDRMTNAMHAKLRLPSHPVTQSPSHKLSCD